MSTMKNGHLQKAPTGKNCSAAIAKFHLKTMLYRSKCPSLCFKKMNTKLIGLCFGYVALLSLGIASSASPAKAWDRCQKGFSKGAGYYTECIQYNPSIVKIQFASGQWIQSNCGSGTYIPSVGISQALAERYYLMTCGAPRAQYIPAQQMGIDATRIMMESLGRQYDYR